MNNLFVLGYFKIREIVIMKTIGLIGGMSWESTITYYQVLNEAIKQVLGGLHSAKCILYKALILKK